MLPTPSNAARILVVEDEPAIAESLLYALRADGFAADHVLLGAEAMNRQSSAACDLIVLDLGLPDMTGFDVLRGLRSTGDDVPVIFLTARGEEIDRVLGLELGADDYVTKPFSPREVTARVRAILRRGQRQSSSTTIEAPVAIVWRRQPDSMRIDYRGVALELTRYEYRLLDLLVTHPGRVFTREHIMALVWADALDTTDRTIDAHVKTLRAKLRAVYPEDDPIRTLRGIGYSLAP